MRESQHKTGAVAGVEPPPGVAFTPTALEIVASGLRFPEGPVAMPDGSVIVVEIAGGRVSRVRADGVRETITETGGGPNGAALGPDGALYICNNGGMVWRERQGRIFPGPQPPDYTGGSIQRIAPGTDPGTFSATAETLCTHAGGIALKGPNDIVFDHTGGFWFTDHGKHRARERDLGAVFYARTDGSAIQRIFPLETPNGIGLSPDGKTLYVAETQPCRLWGFALSGPGELAGPGRPTQEAFIAGPGGLQFFDSLAVDAEGHVNVATIVNGGITRISADGKHISHVPADDTLTTNICFGGADMRQAWVTLSSTGRLARCTWPVPGLRLHGQA